MTGMTKDIYLSGKELTQMVQLLPKDVGRYAVVPGPRDRLKGILAEVEKPVKNFSFMEYEMHTGHIDGVKATFMNGGRYSADTAITTELLCAVEIPIIFRLGTCGALREDMKIGDRKRQAIDKSIQLYDKLLVVLSEHSVTDDLVEQAVETALERERKSGRTVLFPIRLDDAVMEIETGWPALIRNTRHIGDFTRWKGHDAYQTALEQLLKSLNAETR